MAHLRASTSSSSSTTMSTVYSLALLSEYTHTLDSLPLDLSRNFADLRELDAVLSSSMASITAKITMLTQMIEQGTGLNQERLWLLTEIAEEAQRLKPGGEDKIRVACQAADNLKAHSLHLRTLSEHIPEFDASTLNRHTTYPHVASKSYMPVALLESGRRRRAAYGSLLTSAVDPSPAKRKRVVRDDDLDGRTPRKEKVNEGTSRPRNGARAKKTERAASPAESMLSAASHPITQPPQLQGSSSRGPSNLGPSRTTNGNGSTSTASKRARSSAYNRGASPPQNDQYLTPYGHPHNHSNVNGSQRETYHLPPSSSHPSLPVPYHANTNGFGHSIPNGAMPGSADWTPAQNQLEGPGMPARNQAYTSLATMSGLASDPVAEVVDGDADGDNDDTTYCICKRVSFGEMIACDNQECDIEWYHIGCVGLEVVPDGNWVCERCRGKQNKSARRANRGGRRKNGGNRGGRGTAGA